MKHLKKKKDLLLLANKLIEKMSDSYNPKQHYQSFIRKTNTKPVKKLQIFTYQSKTFENSSIVDIKPVITEHPKTLHKLSKTIREAEKVGSNSFLYSDTKKSKNFLNEIKRKINLYYNYIKHTKIFQKRLRLDYSFSH